jgi:RNA polymerase sigma-54 factor
MPRLKVHDIYASALKSHKAANHQALQQRLQEARWFIKNIQQRFDTILRVSNAIVERQKNFFIHGELAMRPLVLREIADELGLHESTISRVTTAKYMATPWARSNSSISLARRWAPRPVAMRPARRCAP